MNIEVSIKDLMALIKGWNVSYSGFNDPLVIKAGHSYSDQYGRTDWSNLNSLSKEDLYSLYLICRNSWN